MGGTNSCDFAMKRTRRRTKAPTKKWSMNEKWFGARMTGPSVGTFSAPLLRVRKHVQASSDVVIRTASYTQSGSRVRARSWKPSKCSFGRGSL
jgi:hypothetical protein